MATTSGRTRTLPVPGRQRATTRTSVARQIKDQRRGYARAVLHALARTQHDQPTAKIQRMLRESLTPLGVRPANEDPSHHSRRLARRMELHAAPHPRHARTGLT